MFVVMRACEGCRRRKIKCDAATSNQWPCAACVRLKLHCVPPTMNYDRTHSNGGQLSGLEGVLDFDRVNGGGEDDYQAETSLPPYYDGITDPQSMHQSQESFNDSMGPFHTPPYSDSAPSLNDFSYQDIPGVHLRNEHSFHEPGSYRQPNGTVMPNGATGNVCYNGEMSATELSDVLGELKINENGQGTFLQQMASFSSN